MLIAADDIENAYNAIRDDALSGGCTVLIYVANEGDSLCACKILCTILQSDHISYKITPVSGYLELANAGALLASSEQLKTVIMIGCGGTINVRDFFQLDDLDERVAVYICDSHRPYHLSSVDDSNDLVRIFDDEDQETRADEKSVYPEMLTQSDVEEDEDEGDDYDDEEDEEDEEEEEETQRREGETEESFERRRRRKERRRKQAALNEYYRSSSYGSSAAMLLFTKLAMPLAKGGSDLLWLSVLGLTDQLLLERIDVDKYNLGVGKLCVRLEELFPDKNANKENREEDDGLSQSQSSQSYSKDLDEDSLVKATRIGLISFTSEWRFMLIRHWSLYHSMYHSHYVASRLKIWEEHGRKKLAHILTELGLPLVECKQSYSFMAEEYKAVLRDKLSKPNVQARHGLEGLCYQSFSKQQGRKLQVSASDMVYAITALLERTKWTPNSSKDEAEARLGWAEAGDEEELDSEDDEDDDDEEPVAGLDRTWYRNFWAAYDALSGSRMGLLRSGLRWAMKLQQAIVKVAAGIIRKKNWQSAGPLRYTVLKDNPDLALFCQPLALSKLALFTLDAILQCGGQRRLADKPYVLCAHNVQTKTFLVVGVVSQREKNNFGVAFRQAGETTGADFKHDSFNASIIEIQEDHVNQFLETLHSGIIPLTDS